MARFSRKHYQLVCPPPDAPGAVDERIRRRAAGEQANAEMMARFAPLTPDNAAEAIAWQDARIRELTNGRLNA